MRWSELLLTGWPGVTRTSLHEAASRSEHRQTITIAGTKPIAHKSPSEWTRLHSERSPDQVTSHDRYPSGLGMPV